MSYISASIWNDQFNHKLSIYCYLKPALDEREKLLNGQLNQFGNVSKYENFFLYLTSQDFTNPLYKVATLVFKKPASVLLHDCHGIQVLFNSSLWSGAPFKWLGS